MLAAVDPLVIDEDDRRRRNALLGLELLNLFPAGQQVLFSVEAGVIEHPFGQQPIGTFVVRKLHPVQNRALSHYSPFI